VVAPPARLGQVPPYDICDIIDSRELLVAGSTLLSTSPVFQARHFTDVDEFEIAAWRYSVEFTPLARKISVQQQVLRFPDFDIVVEQSFPRLIDAQLHADCSSVLFAMESSEPVRLNGIDVDWDAAVAVGHGGSSFSATEKPDARFAVVTFSSEIRDRGWPSPAGTFLFLADQRKASTRLECWFR
jgi:AraC family ethanolamine operon transcriptional activator